MDLEIKTSVLQVERQHLSTFSVSRGDRGNTIFKISLTVRVFLKTVIFSYASHSNSMGVVGVTYVA